MSSFIIYLMKVSLVFTLLTIVYHFCLRRLTFHLLNRVAMLLVFPLSLALPMLDFGIYSPVFYHANEIEWGELNVTDVTSALEFTTLNTSHNYWLYFELIYWIGFAVGMVLLASNAIKLFHKIRTSDKLRASDHAVVRTNVSAVFSCFKWVFIPKNKVYQQEDPIFKHELAHVRLLHSYDLLLMELFIVFNWFNPFVLLFRKLLRSIHEYQADDYVLSESVKKSEYLQVMLENIMAKDQFSFASNFKSSTIKNRIEMITKNKSHKSAKIRYAFALPIITFLLLSFANVEGTKPSIKPIEEGNYKRVSSKFGIRKDPFKGGKSWHRGIDFSTKINTPVIATGDGIVSLAKVHIGGYGVQVQIDHGSGYISSYSHLHKYVVKEGQAVKKGDLIAYSGNTGKSVAPHLHYEVRLDGKPVNPEAYFGEE